MSNVIPGSALKGILLMLCSSVAYAVSSSCVRFLSEDFSVYQLVLFRTAIGTSVMLPWLFSSGLKVLRTKRWKLYLFRAGSVYVSNLTWFYALSRMNLAEVTALSFLMPLVAAVILAVWLREGLGWGRLLSVMLGLLGAIVIIRPGFVSVGSEVYAVLFTVLMYGSATAIIRALTLTEDSNVVVFYMFALNLPLAAGPGMMNWSTPLVEDVPVILLFGLASWAAQLFMTRSLACAEAAVVFPAFYFQLPVTAILGFALFEQIPSVWVVPGAVLIIGGSYFSIWSENRRSTPKG